MRNYEFIRYAKGTEKEFRFHGRFDSIEKAERFGELQNFDEVIIKSNAKTR